MIQYLMSCIEFRVSCWANENVGIVQNFMTRRIGQLDASTMFENPQSDSLWFWGCANFSEVIYDRRALENIADLVMLYGVTFTTVFLTIVTRCVTEANVYLT